MKGKPLRTSFPAPLPISSMVPWKGTGRTQACNCFQMSTIFLKHSFDYNIFLPWKFLHDSLAWYLKVFQSQAPNCFPNIFLSSLPLIKVPIHAHFLNALHIIVFWASCIPNHVEINTHLLPVWINAQWKLIWCDLIYLTLNSFYCTAMWKMWEITLNLYWPCAIHRFWFLNQNSGNSIFPICLFLS